MTSVGLSKEKSKKYFIKKSFSRKLSLDVNLRGFLCSCNNREKDCIKESYNILNEYADKLYPSCDTIKCEENEEDIEDSIAKEISNIKAQNKPDMKRFQAIESGAKNFLFIRTNLENPVELAEEILKDIAESKNQKTRFLLRLVPVEITTRAKSEDIIKAFTPLLERHFKDSPQTFSIIFNHRNNNSLSRDEIVKLVADKVSSLRTDHKVDLKAANISIIIEIIKGFAFLSVIPNYLQYKKFNLLALCEPTHQNEDKE